MGKFNGIGFSLNSNSLYNFEDKRGIVSTYMGYMYDRTNKIFEYENLPDTIPKRDLELYIQRNGFACIAEHEGELYAFTGGLGGEPNVYYMPTLCTVANPALNLSKSFVIDKECVIINNDSLYLGLSDINLKYATALMENDISMRLLDINSRLISLLSAQDDRTFESAKKFLQDIIEGKLGIIQETALIDSLKTLQYATSGKTDITDLIEYHQYLKASWYNEIGLQSNYNMKRSTINSKEVQMNDDSIMPLVDNMLECREIAIDKVNRMFGTNIKVAFSSIWQANQLAAEIVQDSVQTEKAESEKEESENEEVSTDE